VYDRSYDDENGSVVNQVKLVYNGFGQLTVQYEAHAGAVDDVEPGVSANVQYDYTDGSNNHARLTRITYPNGRLLHHGYDSGDDANLSRISWLADDNGSGGAGTYLGKYTYLGLGRTVRVDYTEPDLRYDLDPDDDGTHAGLDDFGRVDDLQWIDYDATPDPVPVVRIKHGHDKVGNRLWREDPIAAGNSKNFDELYAYDGVYRLTDLDRGNLVFNGSPSIASKTFAEQWGLDPLGNWTTFKQDNDGNGWDLEQARDHNEANEIEEIDESSAHVGHDAAGNMTTIPQPDDAADDYTLSYDAWNRLVKVVDGESTVAEYRYDGLGRRIRKFLPNGEDWDVYEYYYSSRWQALEVRKATEVERTGTPLSELLSPRLSETASLGLCEM